MAVKSEEELREIYKQPKESVLKKILPKLDKHCRNFIEHSPFLVMATANSDGQADASPKGDAPGFVKVVDDHTLIIPDRIGNNIADCLRNILQVPEIGLIFFIPGIRETLRINGSCQIIADEETLAPHAVNGKPPQSAFKVTVRETYMHCGKSIIRSDLWEQKNRVDQKNFPTLGQILSEQIGELDATDTDVRLENSYKNKLY
ncbi:MAG: pyridoxamine 5'-phosphate oxidase [SAR86 cluster bacterium]|uniref:Pyridoxamine 5'-phosphate oxidase n=1 Tax=SAR86 cluster bacterium TaxID=2030880 RepID=A0A2A4X8G7_9GAMM|nr:pyridoxamine 5'-phosphate oxidase family protein [Sneathiella sp.]PCI78796.1 MAG: pyridoxamine 5'-phosphate oxidase [SAR86 cluster bacterium]